MVVQPNALERARSMGTAEPRNDARVRREQPSRAQQQRRLSGTAWTNQRDRLANRHRELDIVNRARARETRSAPCHVSFGEPGDFERGPHTRSIVSQRSRSIIVAFRRVTSGRNPDWTWAGALAQRGLSDPSTRPADHALCLRPSLSANVMMSGAGPAGASTPPPGPGTRSSMGRSRVVRRKPCPS